MERHRSIQPASSTSPDHERPSTGSKDEGETTKKRMKRGQTTAVACLSCRHYKCKCDGGFPTCGNCAAKGRSECKYDYEGGERRTVVLRETIRQLKDENTHLRGIIEEQNRQRTMQHEMDPFAAAAAAAAAATNVAVTGPAGQPSSLSISIPDFSPTASAPLSAWTPLSTGQPPPGMMFDPGPHQFSSSEGPQAMDYDQLWPIPAMPEVQQATSAPSDDQVNLSSSGQAPGPHPFPEQRR